VLYIVDKVERDLQVFMTRTFILKQFTWFHKNALCMCVCVYKMLSVYIS